MSDQNIHIHIHVDVNGEGASVPTLVEQLLLDQLEAIRNQLAESETDMSAQSEAIAALVTSVQAMNDRVVTDVLHLRDLLDQATATKVEDAAQIAALQADADSTVASITSVIDAVNAVDPDAEFPVVPEPTPPEPVEDPNAEV